MPRPDRIRQVDIVLRVLFHDEDFEQCPEESSVDGVLSGLNSSEALIAAVTAK